jgi:hypothetical protein
VHTDLHHDLEKHRPGEGGVLAGLAAIGVSGAVTFLAERYRRIARRPGKAIAQAAVAPSL